MNLFKKMMLVSTACLTLGMSAAHANLITNGGFETGNLSGWTAVSNAGPSGCGSNVWTVNTTGAESCRTMGKPSSGSYAAYNTFDGAAANYTLSQTITLPGSIGSAALSFMDEYTMNSYTGTTRTFSVDLYDAANTVLLSNFYLESAKAGTSVAWTTHNLDISAALQAEAGQTVTLRFTEVVPTAYTGAAGFGLDNISLNTTAAVPEPATLALLGLGLLGLGATRRKTANKA